MGMTIVEKILARASGYSALSAGDIVEPAVDLAMSHENAALVCPKGSVFHLRNPDQCGDL